MHCARCQGLMVAEHFIDMKDSSGPLWRRGWRCVNCGNLVDSVIAQHHTNQSSHTQPLTWVSAG